MKEIKRMLAVIGLSLTVLLALAGEVRAAEQCSIAWSHYTGWEPAGYAQSSGIAAKWGKAKGVDLRFVLVNDYMDSLTQFTGGSFQGVTTTVLDGMTGPVAGGVDTTVVAIGDYSNGNDAVLIKGLAKQNPTMVDLRGLPVRMVKNSVSTQLLVRALQAANMTLKDLGPITNVSDADIGNLIATESTAKGPIVYVTWNPMLLTARQVPGVQAVFTSANIPGEIKDTVMMRTDTSPACKSAATGAWLETLAVLTGSGPATDKAIKAMAKQAGGTLPEFRTQLETTYLYATPATATAAMMDSKLVESTDFVRHLAFDWGLFGVGFHNLDAFGIQFPGGKILGNAQNVKLRFSPEFLGVKLK